MKAWLQRKLKRGANAAVNYRALVEGSLDVIFQVRLMKDHFIIEYVSPSVEETLGRTVTETLRLTPPEVYTPASLQQVWCEVTQLLNGSPTRMAELEVYRKDGSTIWVDCRVRLMKHSTSRESVVVVANMHDITDRKRLEDELSKLVLLDALTGVGSRRAFDSAVKREWLASQTTGLPLSLVMVDVDHFKRLNDTCGHPAGDACLQAIAQAIKCAVNQPQAFLARYGGEELAILLPSTDAAMAEIVAEHVRRAVEKLRMPPVTDAFSTLKMTVSCGVSTLAGLPKEPECMPDGLIAAADRALYRAKEQGRNRVQTEVLAAA